VTARLTAVSSRMVRRGMLRTPHQPARGPAEVSGVGPGDGGWDHSGTGASSGGTGGDPVRRIHCLGRQLLVGVQIPVVHARVESRPRRTGRESGSPRKALKNGPEPSDSPNDNRVPLEQRQSPLQIMLAVVEDLQHAVELVHGPA